MAIEGGGELDRLYKQLSEAQTERQKIEQTKIELHDHLRAANQTKEDALREAEELKQQLVAARRDFSDAQRVAANVPELQQELLVAKTHAKDLRELHKIQEEDVQKSKAAVDALAEELLNVKSALAEAQAEAAKNSQLAEAAKLVAQGLAAFSG